MIYRMLLLSTCCWGSNISIQVEVGKLNGDLIQLSGIRYEVWSFSVICLISIAYWKGLISRVKLSVVVLQAIGIYLRNMEERGREKFPIKDAEDQLWIWFDHLLQSRIYQIQSIWFRSDWFHSNWLRIH